MKKKSSTLEKLAQLQQTVIGEEKAKTRRKLKAEPEPSPATTAPAEKARTAVSIEAPPVEAPTPGGEPSPAPPPATTPAPAETPAFSLTSSAQQKLRRHCEGSRWTPELLIEELIQTHLHTAYARITYRGTVLNEAGCFFSLDRATCPPAMILRSSVGKFLISARKTNPEYTHWLAVYQKRQDPEAHENACKMCVYNLQQRLDAYAGPESAKIVYPEDFLIETIV